jgi:hypothetical protein
VGAEKAADVKTAVTPEMAEVGARILEGYCDASERVRMALATEIFVEMRSVAVRAR